MIRAPGPVFDRVGLACAVGSPMCLALVPIFVTLGFDAGAAVVPLLLARTSIAAVAAWAIVAARDRGIPSGWSLDGRLLAAGLAGVAFGPLAGYVAIGELGPTLFAATFFLHVPALALAVPLLAGRRPRASPVFAACACLAGVVLASGFPGSAGPVTALGIGAAAVNLVGFIVMALLLHGHPGEYDATRFNAEAMSVAAVGLTLVYLVTGVHGGLSASAWLWSAAIALAAWLPGRLLWTLAIQRVGARTAATFSSLQPMLVALMGVGLLGRGLAPLEWLGIAIICVAVAGLHRLHGDVADDGLA